MMPKPTLVSINDELTKFKQQWSDDIKNLTENFNIKIDMLTSSNYPSDPLKEDHIAKFKRDVLSDITSKIGSLQSVWDKRFEDLDNKIAEFNLELIDIQDHSDQQDQFSRCSSLIIHGLPETDGEDPVLIASNFINEKFGSGIACTDISVAHRLGKKRLLSNSINEHNNGRPILVGFLRMSQKDSIFKQKKVLKGSFIMITENLSHMRSLAYGEIRKLGVTCWTHMGNIFVMVEKNKRIILKSISKINEFIFNYKKSLA